MLRNVRINLLRSKRSCQHQEEKKKKYYVVKDEAWDHSDNCKVCAHDVELQVDQPQDQESPERPSPGVVKRKATDSFLTPQGKKAQRTQSGSGHPRHLFEKTMDVHDDTEVEVQEHAIHIASDIETMTKQDTKDKNIFEAFKCVIWVVLMVTHGETASCFTKIRKVSRINQF